MMSVDGSPSVRIRSPVAHLVGISTIVASALTVATGAYFHLMVLDRVPVSTFRTSWHRFLLTVVVVLLGVRA